MEPDVEHWLQKLTEKLQPQNVIVATEGSIVGYTWNKKTKTLQFLNKKETEKLTRKNRAWKRLLENWYEEK